MLSDNHLIVPLPRQIELERRIWNRHAAPHVGDGALSSSLSGGEKIDRARKVGVLIKKIVRLGFRRSARVTLRAEQDRLHPDLPRPQNVPEAIVSDENRLFGADLQFGQGRLKQTCVGLAIAVVAGDDDGSEILGKADGAKFGYAIGALRIGNYCQPIARFQLG